MTANNTADIYWQGKIYQGVDAGASMYKYNSVEVIGSHNFTNGQPVVEGKDYELKPRSEFYKGNYSNICALCKKEFHGTDKLWFCCPECCAEVFAVPLAPKSEQEQDNQPKNNIMKPIAELTDEDAEILAAILHYDIPDDDGVKEELIETYDSDIEGLQLGRYLPIPLFFAGLNWLKNNEYDMDGLVTSLGITSPAADTVNKTEGGNK